MEPTTANSAFAEDSEEWVLLAYPADDWVIAGDNEGSISAVFFPSASGCASAACFGRRLSSRVSVLPPFPFPTPTPPAAASSSRGRLLLRAAWSRYFVCDPAAGKWDPIPVPPRAHFLDTPDLALISNSTGYFVVAAFKDRFEIYSSEAAQWSQFPALLPDAIVPGSSAAACGTAYWKTTGPSVLAVNPAARTTRVIPAPPGVAGRDSQWQLGVALRKLCAAVATDTAIEVYGLTDTDEWDHLGSLAFSADGATATTAGDEEWELVGPLACGPLQPRPLRFESENLEVVLRVGGVILAVDLESKWTRAAKIDGAHPLAIGDEEIVPYMRAVAANA